MFRALIKFFPLGFLSLGSILLLSGCESTVTKPVPVKQEESPPLHPVPRETRVSASSRYKVALLLPLSGSHQSLGQALQQAAELSLFDHADDHLELLIEDTQETPLGTQRATEKVIKAGAHLILGPVFSENVSPMLPLIQSHNIHVLSFSNNREVAGKGVFVLGFNSKDQIRRIVRYAQAQGCPRLISYVPATAYGYLVSQTLQELAQERRGYAIETYTYTLENLGKITTPPSVSSQIYPPREGLLLLEGGLTLNHLISALIYHELPLEKYQLLGTGQWDDPTLLSNSSLKGSWFTSSDSQNREEFQERYKKLYREPPPRLATLAYDAVSLAAALVKKSSQHTSNASRINALNPTGIHPFTYEALTQRRGFSGIDGIFRLNPDGTTERLLAVLEMTPLGLRVIDPAPTHF